MFRHKSSTNINWLGPVEKKHSTSLKRLINNVIVFLWKCFVKLFLFRSLIMIKALAISTVGPGLDMLLIDTDLSYTVLFSSPFSFAVVLIPPL